MNYKKMTLCGITLMIIGKIFEVLISMNLSYYLFLILSSALIGIATQTIYSYVKDVK